MQVKGSFLVDFVKVIRANKDKDFDKWLTSEDWEIINSKVLPSLWFPFDAYRSMGEAIFNVVANESLEVTRVFGQLILRNLLETYTTLVAEGDPAASVKKFAILRNTWFKGIESTVKVIDKGPDRVKVKLFLYDRIEPEEAFAYLLAGNLEELVKQTGVKDPKVDVEKVEDGYEYNITWAQV